MDKNIDYYIGLPYSRELIPEPEGGWFIRIVELPGCMSQGETVEEANEMIEDAMRGWLEAELACGAAIPEPRPEEAFSGKFVVRIAKSLHRKIDEISEREGVSLNQWINTVLAEATGKALAYIPEKAVQTTPAPFSGLFSAIREILQNTGLNRDTTAGVELLFGGWLEQNLAEIRQDYQQSRFDSALTKIHALNYVIEKYSKQSPFMRSIQASVENQIVILEATCTLKNKADQADQMRLRIGSIIGLVNAGSQPVTLSEAYEPPLVENLVSDLMNNLPKEK